MEIKFATEWLANQLKINEDKLLKVARKGYYSEILYSARFSPSIYHKDTKENEDFFRVMDHVEKITIDNIWFVSKYPVLGVGEHCIVAHWD